MYMYSPWPEIDGNPEFQYCSFTSKWKFRDSENSICPSRNSIPYDVLVYILVLVQSYTGIPLPECRQAARTEFEVDCEKWLLHAWRPSCMHSHFSQSFMNHLTVKISAACMNENAWLPSRGVFAGGNRHRDSHWLWDGSNVLNAKSEFLIESDWDSHCFLWFLHACWRVRIPAQRIETGFIVAPPARRFQRGTVEQ